MVLALGRGLHRTDYVSDEVFAKERTHIGREGFMFVGRESDLALPGSFLAVEPWGERIVVHRGHDLELRAFVDSCVHRGLPLTRGSEGMLTKTRGAPLVCPYHGICYGEGGTVRAPRALSASFAGVSLSPRVVAVHWGNVFVALGPSTSVRSFETYAKGAPPWLDESFHASLTLVHRSRFRTQANWKLIVENFQESWHFPHVHTALHARTPHGATTSLKLGKNWFGGTMKFEAGTRTVAPSRTLGSRKYVAGVGWRKHVYDAFMFPLWLTSLQPDYFLTYRLVPLTPLETEVQADIWGHVSSALDKAPSEWTELVAFWQQTNDEDRAIVERQMLGVRAPSFGRMRLVPEEEDGIVAFNRRYEKALRASSRKGRT